jgi:hypothetical protein
MNMKNVRQQQNKTFVQQQPAAFQTETNATATNHKLKHNM